VNKAIEIKRAEKTIGNSLEAKVTIFADKERLSLLQSYKDLLPALFIVSQSGTGDYTDAPEDAYRDEEVDGLAVVVEHAGGKKCLRCWNWSTTVGEFADAQEVCQRCYHVLSRIKKPAITYFIISLIVLILDQATKLIIVRYIHPYESIQILPFFRIVSVRNPGAAFGMFQGLGPLFFIIISFIAIGIISFMIIKGKGRGSG